MAKLVVDNSTPEALQRRIEAQIQVAFAKLASNMLEFLCGELEFELFGEMQEFVSIYEAAMRKSADRVGPDIRIPNLRRDDANEDEPTNAVLRGALRAVAALLNLQAEVPLDDRGGKKPTKREMKPYINALGELTSGLAAIQERKRTRTKVKKRNGR
jgi:hypothetical protein